MPTQRIRKCQVLTLIRQLLKANPEVSRLFNWLSMSHNKLAPNIITKIEISQSRLAPLKDKKSDGKCREKLWMLKEG